MENNTPEWQNVPPYELGGPLHPGSRIDWVDGVRRDDITAQVLQGRADRLVRPPQPGEALTPGQWNNTGGWIIPVDIRELRLEVVLRPSAPVQAQSLWERVLKPLRGH